MALGKSSAELGERKIQVDDPRLDLKKKKEEEALKLWDEEALGHRNIDVEENKLPSAEHELEKIMERLKRGVEVQMQMF